MPPPFARHVPRPEIIARIRRVNPACHTSTMCIEHEQDERARHEEMHRSRALLPAQGRDHDWKDRRRRRATSPSPVQIISGSSSEHDGV